MTLTKVRQLSMLFFGALAAYHYFTENFQQSFAPDVPREISDLGIALLFIVTSITPFEHMKADWAHMVKTVRESVFYMLGPYAIVFFGKQLELRMSLGESDFISALMFFGELAYGMVSITIVLIAIGKILRYVFKD